MTSRVTEAEEREAHKMFRGGSDLGGTPSLTSYWPESELTASTYLQGRLQMQEHGDIWRALLATVTLPGRLKRPLEMVISGVSGPET